MKFSYVTILTSFILILSIFKETSGNLTEIQLIYRNDTSLLFFFNPNNCFYSTFSLSTNSPDLLLRKIGHFVLYGFLAIFIFYLHPLVNRVISKCWNSIIWASTIGFIDEYHQHFLIGRSGRLQDVLINIAGSITAVSLLLLLIGLLRLRRRLLKRYVMDRQEKDIV